MRRHPGPALISQDGKRFPGQAQSICVHGDNEHAFAAARMMRPGLTAAAGELAAIPALTVNPSPHPAGA